MSFGGEVSTSHSWWQDPHTEKKVNAQKLRILSREGIPPFPTVSRFVRELRIPLMHKPGKLKTARLVLGLERLGKNQSQFLTGASDSSQGTVPDWESITKSQGQRKGYVRKETTNWNRRVEGQECQVGCKFQRTEEAGKWRITLLCRTYHLSWDVSRSLNILTHFLQKS